MFNAEGIYIGTSFHLQNLFSFTIIPQFSLMSVEVT